MNAAFAHWGQILTGLVYERYFPDGPPATASRHAAHEKPPISHTVRIIAGNA